MSRVRILFLGSLHVHKSFTKNWQCVARIYQRMATDPSYILLTAAGAGCRAPPEPWKQEAHRRTPPRRFGSPWMREEFEGLPVAGNTYHTQTADRQQAMTTHVFQSMPRDPRDILTYICGPRRRLLCYIGLQNTT